MTDWYRFNSTDEETETERKIDEETNRETHREKKDSGKRQAD